MPFSFDRQTSMLRLHLNSEVCPRSIPYPSSPDPSSPDLVCHSFLADHRQPASVRAPPPSDLATHPQDVIHLFRSAKSATGDEIHNDTHHVSFENRNKNQGNVVTTLLSMYAAVSFTAQFLVSNPSEHSQIVRHDVSAASLPGGQRHLNLRSSIVLEGTHHPSVPRE